MDEDEVGLMDLISIIIPLYNKEKYIEKTLLSAINQTYKNIEIIIVDDGSTDNSRLICERMSNEYPAIRLLNQRNMGVAATRNRGIREAKGLYISFLDADDLLDKRFIEKLYNAIGEANIIYCNHYYRTKNNSRKNKMSFIEGDVLTHYLYNRCTPNTNSWLIKTSFLLEHQFLFPEDRQWGEDMSFFIKLLCHDTNVKCVKERLTTYNQETEMSLSINSIYKIYEDIYWLEDSIQYINMNVLNARRSREAIRAIKTYRIPGAVIYRLFRNKRVVNKQVYEDIKNKYSSYIDSFKFNNGLRSIKLLIYKLLI